MSFLLDTDHLSAHLRRPSGLAHRFFQHSGRLYTSSVALAELYVWKSPTCGWTIGSRPEAAEVP